MEKACAQTGGAVGTKSKNLKGFRHRTSNLTLTLTLTLGRYP